MMKNNEKGEHNENHYAIKHMEEQRKRRRANEESKRRPFPVWLKVKDDGLDFKFMNIAIRLMTVIGGILMFALLIWFVGTPVLHGIRRLITLLMPFILALVISTLLYPILSKTKMSDKKAAVMITLLFISIFTVLIVGIIFVVGNTIQSFMVSAYAEQNAGTLADTSKFFFELLEDLEIFGLRVLQEDMTFNPAFLIQQLQDNLHIIYSYGLMCVAMFFILPNATKARPMFKKMIPIKFRDDASDIMDIVSDAFTKYMRGIIQISFIVGVASAISVIFAAIFGWYVLDYANILKEGDYILSLEPSNLLFLIGAIIVFGVIFMVTNLIPMLGPFIGGFIVVPLILFSEIMVIPDGNLPWIAIIIAGLITIIQQLESMFLQPRIMSKIGKIDGLLVLMGITVFGGLFGVIGMFISTPVIITARQMIRYYNEQYEIF